VELAALSFEEAYERLEEIVRRLEGDDLTIEQSVDLYEQGVALVRQCNERLDSAELRISQLAPNGEGELRVAPLP
jgi:exodeoxyribonuclease VII small subunit